MPAVSLATARAGTVPGMSKHTLTTFLAATALAAAGCGSDEAPEPAGTAAAPAPAAASGGPYGTYVRTVTKADLARTEKLRDEYGPHQERPGTGEYRLVIAKGSGEDVIKTTGPDDFTIDQGIRLAGDVIRITSYVDPARASHCGPEIPAQAQYGFVLSGDELALEPANDDPCADRDAILTGTWKRI